MSFLKNNIFTPMCIIGVVLLIIGVIYILNKQKSNVTKTELDNDLKTNYPTKTDLTNTLNDYTTKIELDATKTDLAVTKDNLATNYHKKPELEATKIDLDATKIDLDATKIDLDATKIDLDATKGDLYTNYTNKTELNKQLNSYVTDSALTAKNYTDSALTAYVTDSALKTLIASTGENSVIIPATGGMLANLPAYGSWDVITTDTGNILSEVSTGISFANILWVSNPNITTRGITYNDTDGIFTFSNKGLYQLTCSLTVTSLANPNNSTSLYTYISAVSDNISGNITIIESSPSFLNLSKASYPLSLNSSIFRITDEMNENLRLIIYNGIVNTGSLKIIWLGL